MPLTDLFGTAWALAATVKAGDVLRPDGDFPCMKESELKTVKRDGGKLPGHTTEPTEFERLYVECKCGKHFLDGQEGEDGELVGLYPA